MAAEWAEIPAYRRSLATALGERRGTAFIGEIERRAGEHAPGARSGFSRTGSSSLRTEDEPRRAECTFLFNPWLIVKRERSRKETVDGCS